MLTDAEVEEEEEEMKKVTKTRKYRLISKQQKLNRSSSSRKNHQSPSKKRSTSLKLTREEIKYQRFVNDLKKDIQFYLNKSLREIHFDPRGTITDQQQISIRSSKNNETKRLIADINEILTGPSLKTFYTQFLQLRNENSPPIIRLRPLEESIVWSNEQE